MQKRGVGGVEGGPEVAQAKGYATESEVFVARVATDLLSGAMAGAVSKTVMAPIERVKLLLQTQHTNTQIKKEERYKGLVDCFRRVRREQGTLSFWRGNVSNVIRYLPSQAVNFALRDRFMAAMTRGIPSDDLQRYLPRAMVAGGATGATSLLVTYPLDFARTRVGVDIGMGSKRKFKGGWDCLQQTVASDGFRGVYRGFDIALVGVVAWRAFYFGGYEAATAKLLGDRRNGTLAQRWVLAQAVTTASGTLIYPLDSVRRRMMMQSGRKDHLYSSSVDCFRKVFAQEGIAGFYRGISANILRGFGGALMLVLVDEIGSALRGATGLPVLGRPDR